MNAAHHRRDLMVCRLWQIIVDTVPSVSWPDADKAAAAIVDTGYRQIAEGDAELDERITAALAELDAAIAARLDVDTGLAAILGPLTPCTPPEEHA